MFVLLPANDAAQGYEDHTYHAAELGRSEECAVSLTEIFQILGNLGEFAGALLLFISLIYVGVQVRSNTRATQAHIFQARSQQAQEFFLTAATSDALSEALMKADWDNPAKMDSLSELERMRVFNFHLANKQRIDNLFYQYKNGYLTEDFYNENVKNIIRKRGRFWIESGMTGSGSTSFNEEVERIVNDAEGTDEDA